MTIDLKPCPFCGGEASIYETDDYVEFFHVACRECVCRTLESKYEKIAIEAWNQRSLECQKN